MKLLIVFIVANIVNVLIQTAKSICTVKCGKWMASITNALAYGFYTWIVILMVADLPLLTKCFIIGFCNLIGVYVVKAIEEKLRKAKLWKVEATITHYNAECLTTLTDKDISFNYIDIGKYIIINCYCPTQKESKIVKEILTKYNAKYFVTETKIL